MKNPLSIAMTADASRGRRHPETPHPYRSLYQRDRDRIVHSVAFRRLEYKTQVFVNHEGDFYRTRLTHTLEVTQIARTIACGLGLNEELTEAVALAHDLGHTPFGHAGEATLDEMLRTYDGAARFEHNLHGLRVVDLLEARYAEFPGINLTFETREAFTRHHVGAAANLPEFQNLGGALLEVQAAIVADEIAYDNHDLDDGLYSQIIHEEELQTLALWQRAAAKVGAKNLRPHLRRSCIIRNLIGMLVDDLVENSRRRLAELSIKTVDDVRACPVPLLGFSPTINAEKAILENFLRDNFYRNPRVRDEMQKAQVHLTTLFVTYLKNPQWLPEKYLPQIEHAGAPRIIADYLAGMTDRFAEQEYQKIVSSGR